MRFAHVSDLHIGKRMKEKSLEEDQRHILGEIVRICIGEKVDGILIAGDIFDDGTSISNESTRMLDDFLTELSDKGVAVFMISGNHDSMDKVNYLSRMLISRQVYISGAFSGKADRIPFSRDGQTVDVYLLPFIRPSYVRREYPEEEIETYEDAVACVLAHSNPSNNKRILVSHQMVYSGSTMPELSDSEFSHIGGLEAVSASVFEGFDYVALGHIHSPMNMGSERIRYCGAPMKYALSRRERDKSVTILDVGDAVSWYTVPLKPLRDVRFVTGTLEDIIARGKADPCREDFIGAVVEGGAINAMSRLREVYPNVLALEFADPGQTGQPAAVPTELGKLDAMEEFEKFFRSKTGEDLSESQRKMVKELFEINGVVL